MPASFPIMPYAAGEQGVEANKSDLFHTQSLAQSQTYV